MTTARDRTEHLQTLEAEGRLLAAAASAAGPSAPVPTCPGWTIRDLVLHQGEVHRWATLVVKQGLAKPSAVPADHLGPLPDDEHLLAWFEDGHAGIVEAVRTAPDDLQAFTFLADPPSPVVFWARRQAHETEIHRVDAESAVGICTPLGAASAADGVDEMLTGFVPRPHTRLRSTMPCTMSVALTDHPGSWHLTIGDGPTVTRRGVGPADCLVSGTAADVHLALWNRRGSEALVVEGDPAVLQQFRDSVQIRWS